MRKLLIGVAGALALVCSMAWAQTAPEGVSEWTLDFTKIPVASTWAQAQATFDSRARDIPWAGALAPIPAAFTGGDFVDAVISRLSTEFEVAEANAAVMRPSTVPYGKVGTDAQPLGPVLCARYGDYDFALRGWMVVLERFWDKPEVLYPETREKILHRLSPATGDHLGLWRFFCGIPVHETENHILMTESSRFLTNELLNRERRENGQPELARYDNRRNGMTRWMLGHLQSFLKQEFQEYNSRPYQPYSVMAIQNLYEFSEDRRIRVMAHNVLDYLAAKFVVSNANMRRLPPFRRNEQFAYNWGLYTVDGEVLRFLGLTGDAGFLSGYANPMQWNFGVNIALPAMLGRYRLPDAVGEKLFAWDGNAHFERFSYDGLELYWRRPEFLVSAGGIYTKIQKWIPWQMPNDGYVMPTTLVPTKGVESDAHQLIRIEGHSDRTRRINTCVGPDFACGLNPVVSSSIPASCIRRLGLWTFVNFTAPECPLDYGVYATVYSAPCDSLACKAGAANYGFFEAAPAAGLAFRDYVSNVLVRNEANRYSSRRRHAFLTTTGHSIEFEILPSCARTWPIFAIDGVKQQRHTRRWPLVQGEFLKADGKGLVVIEPFGAAKGLFLDSRDAMHPRRYRLDPSGRLEEDPDPEHGQPRLAAEPHAP